jgi:dTDP-4-amino-4,6-dideoxygalactose transaminase
LPKEVDPAKFPVAAEMSARELTLPVDQRYGEHEMDVLARALSEACQA